MDHLVAAAITQDRLNLERALAGDAFGITRAVETFGQIHVFPAALALGSGPFALDLGVNAWGLAVCVLGYAAGAVLAPSTRGVMAGGQQA